MGPRNEQKILIYTGLQDPFVARATQNQFQAKLSQALYLKRQSITMNLHREYNVSGTFVSCRCVLCQLNSTTYPPEVWHLRIKPPSTTERKRCRRHVAWPLNSALKDYQQDYADTVCEVP